MAEQSPLSTAHLARARARGGHARGRVQRRPRRRADDRRRAGRASGRAQADVHGLDRRRQGDPPRQQRSGSRASISSSVARPRTSSSTTRTATRRSPARCSPPSTTRARSARAAPACSSSATRATRSWSSSWSGLGRSRWATLGAGHAARAVDLAGAAPAGDRVHRGGPARRRNARDRRTHARDRARAGYFIEPTVFTDVTPDMRIAQEEIFGPVLSVMTFEDEEEALRIANNVHVRAGRHAVDDRPRARVPDGRPARGRDHLDELPALPAGQRAVRGSQAVRPGRGPRRRGAEHVHPPQDALPSTSAARSSNGHERLGRLGRRAAPGPGPDPGRSTAARRRPRAASRSPNRRPRPRPAAAPAPTRSSAPCSRRRRARSTSTRPPTGCRHGRRSR